MLLGEALTTILRHTGRRIQGKAYAGARLGMSEIEARLRQAATAVGVESRIEVLLKSVEEAIESYPDDADPRYLTRLIDQRTALLEPDLALIARIAVQLCENDAARAAVLGPPLATAATVCPLMRPAVNQLRRLLGEGV